MKQVIFYAPFYERIIDEYKAELYIKGQVNIRKKNHILRFMPTMFRIRKGVREYLMETYSDIHFTAPDIYDQKVKASVGTSSEFWELDGDLPEYFHINVYSPTLLYDKLLSPLSPEAMKYYSYRIDSVKGAKHNLQYRISFKPKNKSFQLVSGYLIVSEDVWSVREMRFAGRSEMLRFNNLVRMGDVGEADEFLPLHYNIDADFRFLGNVVDADYMAVLDYKSIKQKAPSSAQRKRVKGKYNLSDSYTLTTDTNKHRKDSAYFNTLRPVPLTMHEQELYQDFFLRRDTLLYPVKPKNKNLKFWGQIGDVLISRYSVDVSKMGSIRCSPLINPLLLSYSGKNGLSYRQEFKYNQFFAGDRLLRIVPKIGYNFMRKELYWSVNSDFDYWPRKRAAFHINVGNGNRIYSSDVLDELKNMPDSIFDFNQIHLDYFKDLYFRLRHSWEIVNGLSLEVGVSMHKRTEVNKSRLVPIKPFSQRRALLEEYPDLIAKIRHSYISFAPRVTLKWTPGQYYYMNGDRKVNLHSKYPSLTVDWERGVSGVFNSTGVYERVEVDVQHNIPVGLMRDVYFRFGWGAFTNQKEMYFVDFANFTRSNLPIGWNDEIGGVFQLLDARWYNSSRQYVRGHLTYEAPFLLLKHLLKSTQYVLNERLYLNALVVPHLKPYIEVGYGIGTNIFDLGVFGSFANRKFREVGCKFTFELFNR
ncbi:DUF5686 family protein [Bacteroides sp. UBA939]|uniref:DUF5686 family protein n=1 Tax=Bacteroides sp. UBA939 TaxID=1946092 RepID=UPI0025BA111A|nr:DUF5686 family protein [Bacteroides sp. UBA939]